jgi:Fe-S cluster assembly iron-binding protein IscA
MKITTNDQTVKAIKEVMASQEGQAQNIRLYIAGMGCSGPSFGLTLDEKSDTDLVDEASGISFIMGTEIYDQIGDMVVELTEGGYLVKPVNPPESACGSCAGSCG